MKIKFFLILLAVNFLGIHDCLGASQRPPSEGDFECFTGNQTINPLKNLNCVLSETLDHTVHTYSNTPATLEEKLMQAIRDNDYKEFKKTLDEGANVNYKNKHGLSVLKLAIQKLENNPLILTLLLQKQDLDIDQRNKLGETVLHELVWSSSRSQKPEKIENVIKIINLLVERGINVNAINKCGETALDDARNYPCDQRIINLLEELSNQKEENDEKCCSICLDPIQEQDIKLPCKHIFHQTCINPWLAKNPTCPNCRKQILPQE